MGTRDIDLSDDHDRFIEACIASGRYRNAEDVIHAGLRLLEQQDAGDDDASQGDS